MTAVITVVRTHPPADLTVCYCGVTTLQPACNISVTPLDRWTWSWHPCAGWPFKTKPSSAYIVITITVPSISYLPISIVQSRVILVFWYKKKTIVKMIKTWKSWKALDNFAVKMFYNACSKRRGAKRNGCFRRLTRKRKAALPLACAFSFVRFAGHQKWRA